MIREHGQCDSVTQMIDTSVRRQTGRTEQRQARDRPIHLFLTRLTSMRVYYYHFTFYKPPSTRHSTNRSISERKTPKKCIVSGAIQPAISAPNYRTHFHSTQDILSPLLSHPQKLRSSDGKNRVLGEPKRGIRAWVRSHTVKTANTIHAINLPAISVPHPNPKAAKKL